MEEWTTSSRIERKNCTKSKGSRKIHRSNPKEETERAYLYRRSTCQGGTRVLRRHIQEDNRIDRFEPNEIIIIIQQRSQKIRKIHKSRRKKGRAAFIRMNASRICIDQAQMKRKTVLNIIRSTGSRRYQINGSQRTIDDHNHGNFKEDIIRIWIERRLGRKFMARKDFLNKEEKKRG
mgnify:FL=1